MRIRPVIATVATSLLAGCVLGPDYVAPATPLPEGFSAAPRAAALPAADPAASLGQWWKAFNDPVLDRLIDAALADNLDIRSASARIIQARAQTEAADAGLFPSIAGTAQHLRYRIPDAISEIVREEQEQQAQPGGPAGGAAGGGFSIPSYLRTYRIGFDATWELDLWGGTVRSIEAARASTEAAYFARRGAVVSTLAEVGSEYGALRATQARIVIARRTEAAESQLLDLTIDRQKHGFSSELETAQARASLQTTRAQLPPLEAEALQHIHALAILLGRLPESMEQELGTPGAPLVAPPEIPVGLPAALLENRPDIRQADRQYASANAQVGVAVARRLPSITLTAGTGYASGALQDLLKASAFTWNAGASLSAPLLDFGKLAANERGAKAAALEAELQYRKTVLQAFQDVEDSLQGYVAARERRASLTAVVEASQLALTRSTEAFKAGLATYLTVLDADRSLAQAQDQLAQGDQAQVRGVIGVYKALGGGWQAGEAALPVQLKLDDTLFGRRKAAAR